MQNTENQDDAAKLPVAPDDSVSRLARDPFSALVLGAIGIVFGDIGTSPLYAIKESFSGAHNLDIDAVNVHGVLSLIFWSLVVVVSLKYTVLMMRIDNRGEGGSLAMLSLVTRILNRTRWSRTVTALGIFAAALFYGDSMLTPAISVLSAVEGLEIVSPDFKPYVIPLTIGILIALFAIQSYGTARIGKVFGVIVLVWFLALAATGISNIAARPSILLALNPWHAIAFFNRDMTAGFLAMGSVFLAVTGAEALYADMGHFGAGPIRFSWFWLVFPSLMLNYLGQGALLLGDAAAIANPFFLATPKWALIPMVVLATIATVIASQAVISGAFSITRQAIQLGFLPRLTTIHTSEREYGQIYLPAVNWALLLCVVGLVLGFGSSSNLAAAYGVAVTGTMLITTILFGVVISAHWHWGMVRCGILIGVLLAVDGTFFAATATKITHGGWFPLLVAAGAFVMLTTWKHGRTLLMKRRADDAPEIDSFLSSLSHGVARVPGTAVFLTAHAEGIPNALLHNLKHNHVIHERVVLLTVAIDDMPHVSAAERLAVQHIGRRFYRATIRFGYMDKTDVPAVLASGGRHGLEPLPMQTSYFLGRETLLPSAQPGMALWREHLFAWMTRNAASAMEYFRLPPDRVVEVGSQIEI